MIWTGKGMKIIALKSSSLAVFCLFFALDCNAASSLFSNYGQIQNVQNYSSNPFWTPNNSSYHQGLPRPVYAQGTDLDTAECTNAVQSLVAVQCMARDNCKNTPLSEIRPAVMVQLSSLPNHNYVTACSGYIDGIYEKYIEYYGNNSPKKTSFPSGTTPNKNLVNTTNQIENPYRQNTPKWRTEINQRAAELEELQRQNGGDDIGLDANSFPATYADLSFSERIANEKAGLEPYKDLKPYRELNVESASEWCSYHPNTPGCSKTTNSGNNNDNNDKRKEEYNSVNNEQKEEQLIAARIHKRFTLSTGDGKPGKSGRGCFAICDKDALTDDLNGKALYPVMDKRFCADKERDGLLVEETTKEPLQMTQTQFDEVKRKIVSLVADKDQCDWHFRDHVFQVGYIYPGTTDFVKTEEIDLDN